MAVTHTNRRGKAYYSHQRKTKSGKPKYLFALRDEGNLADTIPPGYEVYENPNAQVLLRRIQPPIISDEEVAAVKAGMEQYCRLKHFITDVKKNAVVIYTPDQDVDLLADTLRLLPSTRETRRIEVLEKILAYSPMLQFVLINNDQRLFETRRYCFLGSIDDWITVGSEDVLPKLVKTYVKHLGEESYYELY